MTDEAFLKAMAVGAPSGVKFDGEKSRHDLISNCATEGLAKVLTYGAKKYADHNWRKGMNWSRLIAAARRHLNAYAAGEDIDDGPDGSGLPHIDCLACCVHFLSEYQKTGVGTDDRYREKVTHAPKG